MCWCVCVCVCMFVLCWSIAVVYYCLTAIRNLHTHTHTYIQSRLVYTLHSDFGWLTTLRRAAVVVALLLALSNRRCWTFIVHVIVSVCGRMCLHCFPRCMCVCVWKWGGLGTLHCKNEPPTTTKSSLLPTSAADRQPSAWLYACSTIYTCRNVGFKSVPTLVSPVSNTISVQLTMRLVCVQISSVAISCSSNLW